MSENPHNASVDSGHDSDGDDNSGCADNPTFILGSPADPHAHDQHRSGTKILKDGTLVLGDSAADSSDVSSPCDGERACDGERDGEYVDKPTFVLNSPADSGSHDHGHSGTKILKDGTLVLDDSAADSSDVSSPCDGERDGEYVDKPTFVLNSPADSGSHDHGHSGTKILKDGTLVLDDSAADSSDVSSPCDGERDGEYVDKPTFVLGSPVDHQPYDDRDPDAEVPRNGTLVLDDLISQPPGSFSESETVDPHRPGLTQDAAVDDVGKADLRFSEERQITPSDVDQRDRKRLSGETQASPESRAAALSTIRACLLGAATDSKVEAGRELDGQHADKPSSVLGTPLVAEPGYGRPAEREGADDRAQRSDALAVGRSDRGGPSDHIHTEKPNDVSGMATSSGPDNVGHRGQGTASGNGLAPNRPVLPRTGEPEAVEECDLSTQRRVAAAAARLSGDDVAPSRVPVGVASPCTSMTSPELLGQLLITTFAILACATCAGLATGVDTLMFGCAVAALVFATASFWRYLSLSRRLSAAPADATVPRSATSNR